MDIYIIIISIISILFLIYVYYNNTCLNIKQKEKYTPMVVRPLDLNKNQNTCNSPYTNNKRDTMASKCVSVSKYADRLIMNPDEYLNMISKLLNDLSNRNIDVSIIPPEYLKEKDYLGDTDYITKFIDSKINELVKTKSYLQQNGSWKYEYLYARDPTIYYYSVKDENYNVFKIIYTMANPLRSSYTSCIAFITELNGELEIQSTIFLNDFSEKPIDKLRAVPQGALQFNFLDTLANLDFDEYGNTTNYSGMNNITETRDGEKIEVKADIPDEFKEQSWVPQYLPPLIDNKINK